MKLKLLALAVLFLGTKVYSQSADVKMSEFIIHKLLNEHELIQNNSNDYEGRFYKKTFFKGNAVCFQIIEFGANSSHATHFFCYLIQGDTIVARIHDVESNLKTIIRLFERCEMQKDDQIYLLEKITNKMHFEVKRFFQKGNLPQ